MRRVALLVAALVLCACGASVRTAGLQTPSPSPSPSQSQSLRSFQRLHLVLKDATGSRSIDLSGLVSGGSLLAGGSAKDGQAQTVSAAQRMAFELQVIGFDMVDRPENAELLAEFSIGAVRYDPITGWIADQASLVLRDPQTGRVVFTAFADTRFVTPRVSTLIGRLAESVKARY